MEDCRDDDCDGINEAGEVLFLCEDGTVVSNLGDCPISIENETIAGPTDITINSLSEEAEATANSEVVAQERASIAKERSGLPEAQERASIRKEVGSAASGELGQRVEDCRDDDCDGINEGMVEVSSDLMPSIDLIMKEVLAAQPNDCSDCWVDVATGLALINEPSEVKWEQARPTKDAQLEVKGRQKKSLFGLVKVEMKVEAEVDKSGNVLTVDYPWYSFIAW